MPPTARRRFWFITAAWVLGTTLAALVGKEVLWAFTATPGRSTECLESARALGLTHQQAEDAPNAWLLLPLTADLYIRVATTHGRALGGPTGDPPTDWPKGLTWPVDPSQMFDEPVPPALDHAVRTLLDDCRQAGVLDHMDRIAGSRRFVRDLQSPTGSLIDITLPEFVGLRALARLNVARMHLAWRARDWQEAVRSYEHTLAIGHALALQVTLIDRLVASAIIQLANTELRQALAQSTPPPEVLDQLRAVIDRHLALPPLSRNLKTEHLCTLDVINRTHTDDGEGDGRFIPSALAGFAVGLTPGAPRSRAAAAALNLTWFVYPSKAQSRAKADELYADLIAFSESGPTRWSGVGFQGDLRVEQLRSQGYHALATCMPALDSALSADAMLGSTIEGTRLMLAIESFRATHARAPASLAELVPGFLPSIPLDPAHAAGTFGYRPLKPGEDAAGRDYILYSFGIDGTDNGGTHHVDPTKHAYRQPAGEGFDHVFNTLRDPRPR
jgi:hypothetical protein